MTGDIGKPASSFIRWIDHFMDGMYGTTKKGSHRVPSTSSPDKRYERRWRRRYEKAMLREETSQA